MYPTYSKFGQFVLEVPSQGGFSLILSTVVIEEAFGESLGKEMNSSWDIHVRFPYLLIPLIPESLFNQGLTLTLAGLKGNGTKLMEFVPISPAYERGAVKYTNGRPTENIVQRQLMRLM